MPRKPVAPTGTPDASGPAPGPVPGSDDAPPRVPVYLISPATLYWSLPLTLGYLVAVPFAMITAEPWLGRLFKRLGLCGIPEDFDAPKEVKAVMGEG